MRGLLSTLGHSMLDLLFPRTCHLCNSSLPPGERFVCPLCLANLPRSGYHRISPNPMEERFAGIFPYDKATGFFLYSRGGKLSELIQDMKYRGFSDIGALLGELAASELYGTGFFADIDVVVPVPMHWFKKAKRGYNQVDLIAEGIGRGAMIPVCRALRAVRSHRTQTSLSREQRIRNTKGMFRVTNPKDIEGKHVLLVDDICTTGSTLTAAAEAIWQANPRTLTLFTIGVTF